MTTSKHQITGKVVHGRHYGRELGFPTANLDRRQYVRQGINLELGIYAGWVQILNPKSKILNFPAAIVIGPLDKTGLPKIETHLLNFKGNLYGKKLTVTLQKYIRPFKKFKSADSLKLQVQKDITVINKVL